MKRRGHEVKGRHSDWADLIPDQRQMGRGCGSVVSGEAPGSWAH